MQHSHYRYIGMEDYWDPKNHLWKSLTYRRNIKLVNTCREDSYLHAIPPNPILRVFLTATSIYHSLGPWNGQVVVLQIGGKQSSHRKHKWYYNNPTSHFKFHSQLLRRDALPSPLIARNHLTQRLCNTCLDNLSFTPIQQSGHHSRKLHTYKH